MDDGDAADQNDDGGPGRQARYLGLAYDFIGGVVGGGLLGWFLDGHFGWSPWGVLVGTMIGLVGGLVRLVRTANRLQALDRRPQ